MTGEGGQGAIHPRSRGPKAKWGSTRDDLGARWTGACGRWAVGGPSVRKLVLGVQLCGGEGAGELASNHHREQRRRRVDEQRVSATSLSGACLRHEQAPVLSQGAQKEQGKKRCRGVRCKVRGAASSPSSSSRCALTLYSSSRHDPSRARALAPSGPGSNSMSMIVESSASGKLCESWCGGRELVSKRRRTKASRARRRG